MSDRPLQPSSPPAPRRAERERAVRARILAAGRAVVGADGLVAARVEEITRAAGIAKGTFYLYFESKEDLVRALVDEAFHELDAACEAVGREDGADWDRRVAALVRAEAAALTAEPDRMRVLHQARAVLKFEREEWRSLREALHRHLERLADRIAAPPRPAALDRSRALELAALLFGSVSGSVSVWATAFGAEGFEPRSRRIDSAIAAACRAWLAAAPGAPFTTLPESPE